MKLLFFGSSGWKSLQPKALGSEQHLQEKSFHHPSCRSSMWVACLQQQIFDCERTRFSPHVNDVIAFLVSVSLWTGHISQFSVHFPKILFVFQACASRLSLRSHALSGCTLKKRLVLSFGFLVKTAIIRFFRICAVGHIYIYIRGMYIYLFMYIYICMYTSNLWK